MWDVESNGSKVQEYVEKSSGKQYQLLCYFPRSKLRELLWPLGLEYCAREEYLQLFDSTQSSDAFLYIAAAVEYMFKTNQHECQNHQHIYVVQLQMTSTCKYMYAVRFFKDPIMSKLGRVVITPAQEQTQSKTTKHRIHHPLTLCLQFFRLTNPKVKQMYQHS